MWLIDRFSDGLGGGRIALPAPLRTALMRWYVGDGTRHDEDAGITLVQQARLGLKWIACDCLGAGQFPPILTPAFLSEAETYYLRRLTSSKRPEHVATCPFFRDQVTNRITQVRNLETPFEPPSGFFAVLRPAPEKLAQRPDDDASDDRTRNASIPRLARLQWRLLEVSRLNLVNPLREDIANRAIGAEFRAVERAAARIDIAPGMALGRALWTHAQALHSRRAYAKLRELSRQWPRGHAPQGFLTLFAPAFQGSTIYPAGSDAILVANRVQSPSVRNNPVKGPYLVIVVIGEYPEAKGFAPLRAYAQPIYSGNRFVPVETDLERTVLRAILQVRRTLDRNGIDLFVEKPLFDILTPLGSCRPSFLIEARSRATGEIRSLAIRAGSASSGGPSPTPAKDGRLLEQLAPVLDVSGDSGGQKFEALLLRALDL